MIYTWSHSVSVKKKKLVLFLFGWATDHHSVKNFFRDVLTLDDHMNFSSSFSSRIDYFLCNRFSELDTRIVAEWVFEGRKPAIIVQAVNLLVPSHTLLRVIYMY